MNNERPSADDLLFGAQPDKNDAHCRQQLSAMIDGCLAADQERFLLRRLRHDRELGQCWERWQIYGDLMRGHAHALLPPDFATRVASAVQAERDGIAHAVTGPADATRGRLLRWGSGAALAASVAMVGFLAGRQFGSDHATPTTTTVVTASQTPLPTQVPAAAVAVDAAAPSPFGIGGAGQQKSPDSGADNIAAGAVLVAAAQTATNKRAAANRRQIVQVPRAQMQSNSVLPTNVEPMQSEPVRVAQASMAAPTSSAEALPAFPLPDPVAPATRPWPRALLGAGDAGFRVDYGRDASAEAEVPAFFQPRLPLPLPGASQMPSGQTETPVEPLMQ